MIERRERNGQVAVFESGPNRVGGWGFDEIVARTPFAFRGPRAIQPDHRQLSSGVWIVHQDPLGSDGQPTGQRGGALSNMVLSGVPGQMTLLPGERPHLRELELTIARSIGEGAVGLSGVPFDVAFDDQSNLGALANYHTPFSSGRPALTNGKNLVRAVPGAGVLSTNEPTFAFVPTRAGLVDVIELATGQRVDTDPFHPGLQSIPASGVWRAMDYFRQ